MRPSPPPGRRPPAGRVTGILADQGGIALVLTLLVVTLLSAMIIDFDYRTRLDVRAASNFRDAARADFLAQGAVDAARAVLMEDLRLSPSVDFAEDEIWGTPISGYPVADGTISVAIVDEGGKLDLNTLVNAKDEPDTTRVEIYRRLLEELFEPDQVDVNTLVDSAIDWIDGNLNERSFGAEAPYYGRLDPPYTCADGPLRTFDELGLVQGYTAEVLERLRPHVTALWTGRAGFQRDGKPEKGNININTASTELLSALHPLMSEELAKNIVDDRPFQSTTPAAMDQVLQLGTDISQEIAKLADVRSDYFTIESRGSVGETSRIIRVTVRRQGNEAKVIAWRAE
jgi:general secretion pathway protein K